MSTWERFRRALRREKADIDEAVGELKDRANAALDQRERELDATPSERLEMEKGRARDIDDDIEAIRRKIERGDG
jgi:predicted phage gp36 major capsid-like protein